MNIMKTLNIKRKVNKKSVAKIAVVAYILGASVYGTVAGYNNASEFAKAEYTHWLTVQAKGMNLVQTETKVEYVVDPEKSTEKLEQAAKQGAKAGADESIKANLGK